MDGTRDNGANYGAKRPEKLECEPLCNENVMYDGVMPPKDIKIHRLDSGYLVKVGCQEFAFETIDKLMNNLDNYLKDPQKVTDNWMNHKQLF